MLRFGPCTERALAAVEDRKESGISSLLRFGPILVVFVTELLNASDCGQGPSADELGTVLQTNAVANCN